MARDLEAAVAAHYGKSDLAAKILDGLSMAAADPENPTAAELAPVDEFHTAGRKTTIKALDLTPLAPGMHVLDVGCGIGGTARYLVTERACRVKGIDLTPEYIEVADMLTQRMGVADACKFQTASALDLPFADAVFDAAVSFHAAMNIEDRPTLYGEIGRVLKPGAPLCQFDVMNGPTAGMLYPVPWAETEATSFLKTPDEMASLLDVAGFQVIERQSLRDFAIDFFREVLAKAAESDGPPPLGLHLLTGANAPEKFANYAKALDAYQIDPVIMVARKI